MDEDNDLEGIRHWADLMNKRGHAPMFARNSDNEKQIVELATAREFSQSARAKYGLQIDDIESNPEKNGVPDCYANLDGKRIGIELTELVDGSLLDEISGLRREGREVNAYSGERFVCAQWDKTRLLKAVSERICHKEEIYRNRCDVDILIIHTDEPWLKPEQVVEWLLLTDLKPTNQIRSAYLLMTHVPDHSENWPVFRIF